MAKTHYEIVAWIEAQMQAQGITRAELARRGDMTQGALSNLFSGKRGVSKRLGQKIAAGLGVPQFVAFRGLGIADDDEPKTTKTGQYIAGLIDQIEDEDERENAIGIVSAILRQIAKKTKSSGATPNKQRKNNPTGN